MELFLHDVRGHHKGAEWKITDGTRRYEFTTNWVHILPYVVDDLSIETIGEHIAHLHELLEPTGIPYQVVPGVANSFGGTGALQVEMERRDFNSIRDYLKHQIVQGARSTSELDQFQTGFTELARWEFPRYHKLKLSEQMRSQLDAQNALNEHMLQLHQYVQRLDPRVEAEMKRAEAIYDQKGIEGIVESFQETYEEPTVKPIPAHLRKQHRERLDMLVTNSPRQQSRFEKIEHRRLAIGVLAKSANEAREHAAAKLVRAAIKNPKSAPDDYSQQLAHSIQEYRHALESSLALDGHQLEYRSDELRFRSHFNSMNRIDGRSTVTGMEPLRNDSGGITFVSAKEFLGLPKAFYDIEKPQFGTWMEVVSWCATLLEQDGEIERILDTDKPLPWKEVEMYNVVRHRFEHELVHEIGKRVDSAYLHFIYNVNYEAAQMRDEGSFTVAGKTPRKRATVDPEAQGHNDFMGAWTISRVAETVDMMRFSRNGKPHRSVHRLESYMNHQAHRAGLSDVFAKLISYEMMRKADQWAGVLDTLEGSQHEEHARTEALSLARYGVSDVEIMYQNLLLAPTIEDFEDIVDIALTFGISISQVTSNANSTRQKIGQQFYQQAGFYHDEGFFRQIHREEIQRFKSDYTRIKIKTFREEGLNIQFRKGIHTGVDQYYFSPELAIGKLIADTFPDIGGFIERTMDVSDPERQIGRLQYLRAFAIPILSDHNHLRKQVSGKLAETVNALYVKATRQKERERLAEKGFSQEVIDEVGVDEELLAALDPLMQYYQEREGTRTGFRGLKAACNQLTNAFETNGFEATSGVKGLVEKVGNWRNRASFFSRLYGIDPQQLEDHLLRVFSSVADLVDSSDAEVLQAEGKFLYISGEIDQEQAQKLGLIKIQEDLTILNMGEQELTYDNDGFYKGKTAMRAKATAHASLYQTQTEYAVLDAIFSDDYQTALATIATRSRELALMDENSSIDDRVSLLRHNRSRNCYLGFVAGEEKNVEISELEKEEFQPDYDRYREEYQLKFFGLKGETINTRAKLAKIIHAVIPLNKGIRGKGEGLVERTNEELYHSLISETEPSRLARIAQELSQDYRRRDFEEPFTQELSGQLPLFPVS